MVEAAVICRLAPDCRVLPRGAAAVRGWRALLDRGAVVARPRPAECPAPRPAAPPPVTLDTADMAAPLVLLAAAILATFVLLTLEIAADKTIDSGSRYLRQKLLHLKDGRLGAKVDPQLR